MKFSEQDLINEMNSVAICNLNREIKQVKTLAYVSLGGLFSLVLGLILALVAGCSNIIYNPPDPEDILPDCQSACARLLELECQGWQGSPGEDEVYGTTDDVGCVEACGIAAINPEINLQLSCVATATSCADYEGCY